MKKRLIFGFLITILFLTTIFAFEYPTIQENSIFTRFYEPVDTSQDNTCLCSSNMSGCLAFKKGESDVKTNCMSSYGITDLDDCKKCKYCEICVDRTGNPTCIDKNDFTKIKCPFSFNPCDFYLNTMEKELAKEKCPYIKKNNIVPLF